MKNIIIKIMIVLLSMSYIGISTIWNTYAEGIKVVVVEKIPWAGCTQTSGTSKPNITYDCTVEPWFNSMISLMWKLIKYFTYIAWLWAVLFIVINGIMYSMWWADSSMKEEAKKRVVWTLTWLVLLFLSWIILNLVAPWFYK